jgi:drug/metabolite transporter (DMT)-like permease
MKLRESIFLLLLAALWGGSFLFIRLASPALGPVFLMDARVVLAAVALLLYAVLFAYVPRLWARWRAYLLLGTLNAALPFTLIAFAELHLPASLAAILNATTPLFTAIVAFVWLHDPMTHKKLLGIVLGMIGVAVLVGWSSFPLTPLVLLSIAASLLAACFYGIGGVYSKRAFQSEPPLALAIGQQLGAGIVLLPFAGASIPAHVPSLQIVCALLALALFSTSIGYLIYFHLMTTIGPTGTLSVTFLVPVFGLLWGAVFLKEPFSPGALVGLGIILLGMYAVTNVHLPLWRFSHARPHQSGKAIVPTPQDEQ